MYPLIVVYVEQSIFFIYESLLISDKGTEFQVI